jgi:hypothetical protein
MVLTAYRSRFAFPIIKSRLAPCALACRRTHVAGRAKAKSYHIEAREERTSSNELQRSWQKTLLTTIVMPGGRYRPEGRSGFGGVSLCRMEPRNRTTP